MTRGVLGACVALGLLAVPGCVAREARPEPVKAAPARPATLQEAVTQLAAEAALLSPGTEVAIAVRNLRTGEYAGVADEVPHVSASAAKVLWVAAALARVGTDKVAPHAGPIFRASDNEASGEVIDLIGPDAVNDWYRELGLRHTALTRWRYGKPRQATNSPREMGGDNYFTARDVVEVLTRWDRGELLGGAETEALRQWMTLTPRTGCGGWMGALLPEPARVTLMHKAGWLPPGCCSDDAVYNTLTEVGVVQVPGGDRYAVALLARRGRDYWRRQAPFVERASCVLYRTVSRDASLACHDAAGVLDPGTFGLPESAPVPKDCD
ncbi:serine hydrolase [Archangium lipolyticum]|uniref:serine hydrolase n=1 Tax=Archangium lipolyticum TaxID=2970465 RepID=UPI002149F8E3|nr:serine hydrolase [Archangium lipolyticum]